MVSASVAVVLLSLASTSAAFDLQSATSSRLAAFWPTQVCFSSWSCLTSASHCAVVSASVAVVLLSLASTSAAFDLQSATSSRLAAFWPTQVCFSSWSCLTSASHCAVVSASVAVVLLSLASTSAAFDLQSATSSRLAAFWPTQVCFSSWSCLTSASHCAVVSASVAVVLLSLAWTSAAFDLQSATSFRLAAFWPMQVCFSSWSCAMVALVSFW